MNFDPSQLIPLLTAYGPLGWVAAAGLAYLSYRLHKANPTAPVIPLPAPAKLTDPTPAVPQPSPIIAPDLLAELLARLKMRFPNLPLGDTGEQLAPSGLSLAEQHNALTRAVERKRQDLAAELDALPEVKPKS